MIIVWCKICDQPLKRIGSGYGWSDQCPADHYSVRYTYQQHLETEMVIASNFYLLFDPAFGCAWIKNDLNMPSQPFLKSFYLGELTPEIAKDWLNKLKSYVVLQ